MVRAPGLRHPTDDHLAPAAKITGIKVFSATKAREREALRAVLSDEAFVDTCATIAAFSTVDRIADATGIPLDEGLAALSGEVRRELGLARFASAANTRGGRGGDR